MDATLLRCFVPLNALSPHVLDELAGQTEIIVLPPGQVLFRQGDDDPWIYFLLEGQVLLQEHGLTPRIVQADSSNARHALARTRPRSYSAVASTSVRLIRMNEALLESVLGSDQAIAYEVFEYDGSDDPAWMIQVLANKAFRNVPAAHANTMFARFQPVPCQAGDVIIRQGEPAEDYYLIRSGRAEVTRARSSGEPLVLAVLGTGEGFGEEALLTGDPRNASVTMLSDGLLMRLSKQDFDALIKAPLVKTVDLDETKRMLMAGAQLVDVRLEEEYQQGTLRNSINLPLYLLRLKAQSLDLQTKYIIFCQHEERSNAAAFLLAQRGFDTYVLRGGLAALKVGEDHTHSAVVST